jgi:hypothetical protein
MKPLRRNGLKGHQHLAQGIALGRKTNIFFALKGQKPYLIHYAFAPAGRLGYTSYLSRVIPWAGSLLALQAV